MDEFITKVRLLANKLNAEVKLVKWMVGGALRLCVGAVVAYLIVLGVVAAHLIVLGAAWMVNRWLAAGAIVESTFPYAVLTTVTAAIGTIIVTWTVVTEKYQELKDETQEDSMKR